MKLFIAIAVILALLAFTQAQDDSNQPESSDAEAPPSDSEVEISNPELEPSDPEAPPSDRPRPPRPEGSGRPPKPGRHGRRRLHHRIPRPHPNEDQPADNENPESNRPQRLPPRRPVYNDISFDFGKQSIIHGHQETTTAYA